MKSHQDSPGQQGVEKIWSGGIRAQRWRSDKGGCLGPVLAPVVGAIRSQAGSDGLAIHHGSWGTEHTRLSLTGQGGQEVSLPTSLHLPGA